MRISALSDGENLIFRDMYILQGFEINEKVTSKCMFNFFKTIIYVIFQPKKRKKKRKKEKEKCLPLLIETTNILRDEFLID